MVIFRTTTVTSYYTALNVGNTAEQIQLHSCLWIVFLPVLQILQNNAPTETHGAHKLKEHSDPTCVASSLSLVAHKNITTENVSHTFNIGRLTLRKLLQLGKMNPQSVIGLFGGCLLY